MRIDYFDDLLPGGVTRVTHQKKDCVTPETDSATSKNSELAEASRVSRVSRTKTGNTGHEAEITEHLEERAAIMEYDGGLSREKAEIEARKALRVFHYRLTDNPVSSLVLISPGCDLDEATKSLQVRFGKRLIDVQEYKRNE
jgi:hypothetical protein